ncbi:uncharacterized protein LOC142181949 [Nicotiana tabacum]|uniref:Uncharacterized protein LOC142181949 n=1 Tax=Nicotiana tabacum TaxID=4097 RepID=A0AC58UQI8_TOBAC
MRLRQALDVFVAEGESVLRSEALDAFKVYKIEVEKQMGAQIKIVRSDRGGEYYGRYTDKGQVKGPFAEFLESKGIIAQYTMPGTPQQNSVAERRNRTLMDMKNSHELSEQQLVQGPPPLEEPHEDQPALHEPTKEVPEPVGMRKSSRVQKPAISSDYVVYLQESDYDIGLRDDPCSFSQAMSGENSTLWYDAMKEELESMAKNKVEDLIELPKGSSTIASKWVFKTKRDSFGNIERYKARLVDKGFAQREGIDYHETFSPVSKKDSLRIIIGLVAHFELELHQMDVKTAFLNGDLEEEV